MEETDPAALKVFRRGSYFGSQDFRNQLLQRMEGKLGENHSGELRRRSAQAKGERIVSEELKRLGWRKKELLVWRKSDPAKLALAARLRRETTLTIKEIAARVEWGSSKSANARLHEWIKSHPAPAASGKKREAG